MADLVQDLKERAEILVSQIMIAHSESNCWSQLLTSVFLL